MISFPRTLTPTLEATYATSIYHIPHHLLKPKERKSALSSARGERKLEAQRFSGLLHTLFASFMNL